MAGEWARFDDERRCILFSQAGDLLLEAGDTDSGEADGEGDS